MILQFDTEILGQIAEAVAFKTRVSFTRQAHRTQLLAHVGIAQPPKFLANKVVIKAAVVRDEDAPFRYLDDLAGDLVKLGGLGDHFHRDAGQFNDAGGDAGLRIDQTLEGVNYLFAVVDHDPHLGYPVAAGAAAGGFDVNYGVFFIRHVLLPSGRYGQKCRGRVAG